MPHDITLGGRLSPEETARITRRTTYASVSVATILIIIKAWAWHASGSVSLLSSLADSGLDLAASLFTLGAVAYAAIPPDEDHRYGHGKAEGFAALFQAALVGASATLIVIEAIDRLRHPKPITETGLSMIVMVVSILLTLLLIYIQTRALRITGSVATAGDRAHYAADLGANFAVIVGIGASSMLGFVWADPVVGLLVAAWLVWGAIGVAREAADQLMDRELDENDRQEIVALAASVSTELGVHQLRTRMSGPIIHIQFHLEMPNSLSLIEAHAVMVACERRILEKYPGADIIIHPDPRGAQPHGGEFFREDPDDYELKPSSGETNSEGVS